MTIIHRKKTILFLPILLLLSTYYATPSHHSMSSSSPNYVGLDVGTQSTKCILYNPQTSTVLHRSSCPHTLEQNPTIGLAEQDPALWIRAVEHCLSTIPSRYSIDGIGISGQQHGMVILDSSKRVIRPAKLWCDVQASNEADEFTQTATKLLQKPHKVPAGFTAPKVLWLKRNEPRNFANMRYCMLPHDYVTFSLCGNIVTDAGDASGTGYFDVVRKRYDERLTRIIDERLLECLPRVLDADAIAGYLTDEWKERLNHVSFAGKKAIPISVGSGDNMMSALGVGCVKPDVGVMSLGTSGTIFGVSETPIPTDSVVAPFCDATNRYLPLACVMSCTSVLQNMLDQCCKDMETHAEAEEAAKTVPPGCSGLIFLPFLNGERTPDWPHSSGAILGLTTNNLCGLKESGLLYRMVLEGLGYLLKYSLDQMKECCRFCPKELLVVGGGSSNKLWREILANVLELELKFPLEKESAALGAAFQVGAVASGMTVEEFVGRQRIELEEGSVKVSQDESVLEVYREGYKKFCDAAKKLFDET